MVKLWINSEEVELMPGEVIATTVQVNDLEDPDTFQSSFTNTFDIPLTRNNRNILGNAQAIGDNNTMRQRLPARLEDNGRQVVTNGFAVVNEIDGSIAKVTVFDGIADFFSEIGDRSICDTNLLSVNPPTWDLTEVTNNTQNIWTDAYVWALANYGDATAATINVMYQYPSVFVKYLFQEIASQFTTYTWVEDGLYTDSFFESLILPFVNDPNYAKAFYGYIDTVFDITSNVTDQAFVNYDFETIGNQIFDLTTGLADYRNETKPIRLRLDLNSNLTKVGGGTVTIQIKIIGQTSSTVYASDTLNTTTPGVKELQCTTDYIIPDEQVFGAISVTFSDPAEELEIGDVEFLDFTRFTGDPVVFSEEYPLQLGLPDLTIKDFIKDIWKIFGVVPKVDPYLKTISMQKFEDFSTETPYTVDYSSLVDTSQQILREFQYGSYAQSNLFTWENDNLVRPQFANGVIEIDNALLDEVYEWIGLGFSAIESDRLAATSVQICTLTVLDDSLNLASSLNARLGYIKYFTGGGIPIINFTDGVSTNNNVDFSTVNFANAQDSQTLVYASLEENYHDSFRKMIQKMEKLTIFINFNAKQYQQLDFFKPVFLRFNTDRVQVNGVYMLQKIEDYQADKTAKCEFIKLNPF